MPTLAELLLAEALRAYDVPGARPVELPAVPQPRFGSLEPANAPGERFPEYGGSFRERLAMGLHDLPGPGDQGAAGDVFLANLLSGAARGFSGPIVRRGAENAAYNERSAQRAAGIAGEQRREASQIRVGRALQRPQAQKPTLKEIEDEAAARARGARAGAPARQTTAEIEAEAEARARGQRRGAPPITRPATPKPSSGEQKKVLGFYNRMKYAHDALESGLGERIARSGTIQQAIGQSERVPNFVKSADQQQFNSYRQMIAEAHLRRESGATITPNEYRIVDRTYIPQPGDKPPTLATKRMNRETLLHALKFSSGPAYREYYETGEGTPNTDTEYIMDENGNLVPQ